MKLKNEFNSIREWADSKGIYAKGDVKTQYVKLQEEAGELAKAIMKDDYEEFVDAIGDCVVVLVSIAELGNKHFNIQPFDKQLTIEECINTAYDVIAKRTGKMINGTFVKDQD
jgi:NTP pyrophosphatase (non-canonical NTP hydrolase)